MLMKAKQNNCDSNEIDIILNVFTFISITVSNDYQYTSTHKLDKE